MPVSNEPELPKVLADTVEAVIEFNVEVPLAVSVVNAPLPGVTLPIAAACRLSTFTVEIVPIVAYTLVVLTLADVKFPAIEMFGVSDMLTALLVT